jgi:CspA family cold shock protein
MERGTVKWFSEVKGYGFIVNDEGTDVFVHANNLLSEGSRTLREGQPVEFERVTTSKGLAARSVTVIE